MVFVLKTVISALIIAGASELAKRSNFWASILISLPLISILTLSWTYFENRNSQQVQALSTGILWAVIPSLIFFVALSCSLKFGLHYVLSLLTASGITACAYVSWVWILGRFGIQI